MQNDPLKILFIGDIVGKPGRRLSSALLPGLKDKYGVGFTIANGENASGGMGLVPATAGELFSSGIDCLTMGNHTWEKKEIMAIIDDKRLVRPLNYPPGTPGEGSRIYTTPGGVSIGVVCLTGRIFVQGLDCPFRALDKELEKIKKECNIIIVDIHAEATSEKSALAWYTDGRVTAVIGTHTHVQTADERVLPKGTAFITDAGMTGARDSVIGIEKELAIRKFLTMLPVRFEVAAGPAVFCGVIVTCDPLTGRSLGIDRIYYDEETQAFKK